jgi:hypothetical protein
MGANCEDEMTTSAIARKVQMQASTSTNAYRLGLGSLLLIGLLALGTTPGLAKDKKDKNETETVRAVAMGTGTQMGENYNLTLHIFAYSTPEDKQTLLDAFQQGQNQGLVKALNKMKAVGRISTTGTMGYDVAYIRAIDTPTGPQIRFLTNRQIRNIEAATNSTTEDYDLTAGEINVNTSNKKKSTGFIYPAARLVIDKQGEFQFLLNQNSWNLINILYLK